jgi:hypothetical protein
MLYRTVVIMPVVSGSKLEIDGLRHIFDDVALQQAPNIAPI